MQGDEERRLRRMSNTLQGGAIEGNAADDVLMVIRGKALQLTTYLTFSIFSDRLTSRLSSCVVLIESITIT